MDEVTEPSPDPSFGRRKIIVVLVFAVAVAATFVALRMWRGESMPPLSPAQFHAARARWQAEAPPNYDIEIVVTGSQPATYEVHVRGGQPELALRNGKPLTQRRTFGTWSVPGMFGTMLRDVQAVERLEQPTPDPHAPRLVLHAEFDPKYSYPARYRRIQLGSTVEVSWRVTRFEIK
jgi:hypothetical protein